MTKRTKTLSTTTELTETDVVIVEDKIYASRAFIAIWFDRSVKAVDQWVREKGLEASGFSTAWLDLKYTIDWHKKNIDASYSNKAVGGSDNPDDIFDEEFLSRLSNEERKALTSSGKDSLDRLKDLKEIQKRDISNKQALGKLVPAEKLDYGMAELAVVQIGQYRDDLKSLPKKLVGKTEKEIQDELDNNADKRIKNLITIAKKGDRSINKIIDILPYLQDKLQGNTADDIIKVLSEL